MWYLLKITVTRVHKGTTLLTHRSTLISLAVLGPVVACVGAECHPSVFRLQQEEETQALQKRISLLEGELDQAQTQLEEATQKLDNTEKQLGNVSTALSLLPDGADQRTSPRRRLPRNRLWYAFCAHATALPRGVAILFHNRIHDIAMVAAFFSYCLYEYKIMSIKLI